MKRKNTFKILKFRLILIGLFIISSNKGISQISINYFIPDNSVFRQDNIWNFIIINNLNDLTCSLSIHLNNSNGEEILTASTPQFMLKKGSNSNFSILKDQSEIIYGNNEAGMNLQENGILIAGAYQLCIQVTPNDNILQHAEKCVEFKAKEFFVLRLVYPPDNGEIMSPNPVLHWIASPSSPSTRYALKLTVLNEGQSESEALESNPLYINEADLSTNSLLYPFSAPALEAKKNYVWQVLAIRNQNIIAVTEPWIFHLVNLDTVVLVKSDCYRLIHKTSNNEYYINDGVLRFGYENTANDKFLNYKIINLETKKIYKGGTKIPITYGLNKIDIKLNKELKIRKNTRHLLKIQDSDNNSYSLIFNTIKEAW